MPYTPVSELVRPKPRLAVLAASELRSTLDHGQGGELARNLDSLYDYCIRQLTAAHASNEVAKVSEAKALMVQIREAWEIMPLNRAAPVQ